MDESLNRGGTSAQIKLLCFKKIGFAGDPLKGEETCFINRRLSENAQLQEEVNTNLFALS